jgi:serine/arginine repetitive matrix protein 2
MAEILAIEQRIQNAANKPVKKKKRVAPKDAATGTHLAQGTVGGRPRGTAVDAMEAAANQAPKLVELPAVSVPAPAPVPNQLPAPEPAPTTQPATTVPKKKKKKKVVVSDSESDQPSYIPNSSDNDSDVPTAFNTRAGALLAKKPSIVREDREGEEQEDDTPTRATVRNTLRLDTSPTGQREISPSPLPRSNAGRGHGKGQALASAAFAQGRQQARSASQPAPISDPALATTEGPPLAAKGSIRGGRVQSVSPAQTTHFSTTPDNLVVKHQPPPRSISPRKSALKHSGSPRGPSPAPWGGSETSNASDELHPPRKKSVRVSFDETNVVVGQAATPVSSDSPVVQSPQTKRPWYSIGRGKKKDVAVVDDEDDEVMKPRPALPSFGSVREKKSPREIEERALVKPAEPVEAKPALPSPPLFTTPNGEVIENPIGQSNDHAIGALISHDSSTKNAANISKSREPLPPQVLSVEGNGELSETDSDLSSIGNAKAVVPTAEPDVAKGATEEETEKTSTIPIPDRDETPTPTQEMTRNGDVPQIAVSQATPTLDETVSRKEWPDMPGGWGSSTSESGSQESPRVSSEQVDESTPAIVGREPVPEPTPATVGIAEPAPEPHRPGSPETGQIAARNLHNTPAIMEETEESDTSVYSDAAEDLSEGEEEGFMSLDAVVESPVVSSMRGLTISTPPDSPTAMATKERAYRKSQLSKKSSEPDLNESWEKAQEYWKSLSDEKKRELELDAMEDADGSDTEVEKKPKPKKKKKVKPAPAAVPQPRQPNNERTYMIQPGTNAGPGGHPTMRSSMRAEPPSPVGESQMRKSMRSSGSMSKGSMRNSVRGSAQGLEPRGSLQKKQRPFSSPPGEIKADPAAVNMHLKALSIASAAAAPAAAKRDLDPPSLALRRRNSDDSDTSFKRAKPSKEMTFRRSMRGSNESSVPARPQSPAQSSRFSLRSLSPTGSTFRRQFSSGSAPPTNSSQTHMRSSMRGSQGPAPTLRGSSKRQKSPMRLGFGRSGPPKPTPKQRATTKLASRFADSSDEEDSRPSFRSRFDSSDDSDDEPLPRSTAMPRTMRASAPIRGIPKRSGVEDGDSSDLPDSDDERPTSPGLKLSKKRGAQNGTAATTGNQGATLASGFLRRSGSGRETIGSPTTTTTVTAPVRPAHTRRGSIMSILRRKKDPSSKVRKNELESAARRDTPLERSKTDLSALRGEQPSTPKLQKRNPLSRENSGQWPLSAQAKVPDSPPKVLGGEDGRPFTADAGDGVVGGECAPTTNGVDGDRPDIGTRRFTATGLSDVDMKDLKDVNGVEKSKKKKKFGALRRMFRLDD